MIFLVFGYLLSWALILAPVVVVPVTILVLAVRRRRVPQILRLALVPWVIVTAGLFYMSRASWLHEPFAEAAASRDTMEAARLLRRGANPNYLGDAGTTPLVHAVYEGDTTMISFLVRAGADVNLPIRIQGQPVTPLEAACEPGPGETFNPKLPCHRPAVAAQLRRLGARR